MATPRSRGKEGRRRGRWRLGAADVVPGTGLISEGKRAGRGWLSCSSLHPSIPPALPLLRLLLRRPWLSPSHPGASERRREGGPREKPPGPEGRGEGWQGHGGARAGRPPPVCLGHCASPPAFPWCTAATPEQPGPWRRWVTFAFLSLFSPPHLVAGGSTLPGGGEPKLGAGTCRRPAVSSHIHPDAILPRARMRIPAVGQRPTLSAGAAGPVRSAGSAGEGG